MNEHVDAEALDFEFERKFLVKSLPDEVTRHGSHQVIAQAYLFAHDGYAVRVRLSFPGRTVEFPPFDDSIDFLGAYEHRILALLLKENCDRVSASIAVKSPPVGGERYEMEAEVDVTVPAEDAFLADMDADTLADLLIVSQVRVTVGDELTVTVAPARGVKCARCWKVLSSVGTVAGHDTLCPRCAAVVKSLPVVE